MPTIFDASLEEQKKKQAEVERTLGDITADIKKKSSSEKSGKNVIGHSSSADHSDAPTTPDAAEKTEASSSTRSRTMKKDQPSRESKRKRQPEDYSSVLRGERPSNGAFSAFMTQPAGVCFESQHEDEKILLVLRQHPVINLVWVVVTIILSLVPFLLFPFIPLQVILPGNFLFFLMIAWYLFVTAYTIESFLGWYFNMYVITDERIIDIDFYSLIYKSVSEAKLDKIEDVTATTAGFFGAFFNFGNITIQTAAEKREFDFERVPQPAKVTKFLNELLLEEEREKIEGRVM